MRKISVLFVCMGNICRSPLAQGVFEQRLDAAGLSDWVTVDSAGTHAYHIGNPPDPRSSDTARQHGIDISHQRARQVAASDFANFDYIVAMDHDNHQQLAAQSPTDYRHRLHLFLTFAPKVTQQEVPDPYYGGRSGFEQVYQLISAASDGLIDHLRQQLRGEQTTAT